MNQVSKKEVEKIFEAFGWQLDPGIEALEEVDDLLEARNDFAHFLKLSTVGASQSQNKLIKAATQVENILFCAGINFLKMA